jgi:hypothetical protein
MIEITMHGCRMERLDGTGADGGRVKMIRFLDPTGIVVQVPFDEAGQRAFEGLWHGGIEIAGPGAIPPNGAQPE